eukprot:403370326
MINNMQLQQEDFVDQFLSCNIEISYKPYDEEDFGQLSLPYLSIISEEVHHNFLCQRQSELQKFNPTHPLKQQQSTLFLSNLMHSDDTKSDLNEMSIYNMLENEVETFEQSFNQSVNGTSAQKYIDLSESSSSDSSLQSGLITKIETTQRIQGILDSNNRINEELSQNKLGDESAMIDHSDHDSSHIVLSLNSGQESTSSINDWEIDIEKYKFPIAESSTKKSRLIRENLKFIEYQRGDVIFKTILRKMRKFYLEQFNQTSKYVKRKRSKNPKFLVECLENYVLTHIMVNNSNNLKQHSSKSEDIKGLILFLGSMFYPKVMSEIYSNLLVRKQIQAFHDCLYSFSLSKLDYLSHWEPYRFLLHHFLDNYSQIIIEKNKSNKQNEHDFMIAMNFLKEQYALTSAQ